MNLEWKAAELYEFVKQYNKLDELNVYTDIEDNALLLCFDININPSKSEEIRNHIIQKCREKFSWFNIKGCSELGDVTFVDGVTLKSPNQNCKIYRYEIIINNDLKG